MHKVGLPGVVEVRGVLGVLGDSDSVDPLCPLITKSRILPPAAADLCFLREMGSTVIGLGFLPWPFEFVTSDASQVDIIAQVGIIDPKWAAQINM